MSLTLERPRLTQRLAEAARFPIAVIRGAAGSGKSTALRDYLASCNRPYAVYDVAPEHASFARFVRGFAHALGEHAPGARPSFASAYERAIQSRDPAGDLASWLIEHLKMLDLLVVVDNIHNDGTDPRSRAFLSELLLRSDGNVSWMVACRSADAFPVATWLAFRRMDVPLEDRDLSFTRGDVAALAEVRGIALTARDCARVFERSGGWATGVAFLLGAERDELDGAQPVRAFEPLIANALDGTGSWDLRALLSTSFLPDVSPALLASIGNPAAVEAVDRLRVRAPYLFAGSGDAVRFHDLLAAALHALLRSADPRESAAAISIAGHALRRRGRLDEALALYAQAGAVEPAIAILEHHGVELLEQGHAETVERALLRIEATGHVQTGLALALRAIVESRLGRFDTAESWFTQALARSAGDDVRMIEIKYLYACDLMRRNRPDCVTLLREHAGDEDLPLELRASLLSALAQAAMLFDQPGAREYIDEALALAQTAGDDALSARVQTRASYVFLYLNDYEQAQRWALDAAQAASRASMFSVATGAYSVLHAIADETEEPRRALHHLVSLLENGLKSGNLQFQFYFLACTSAIEAERGNLAALERADAALQSFDVHHDEATASETLVPAFALRATWSGNFDHAYALLAPGAATQVGADRVALRWSEVALYAAAAMRYGEAHDAIERTRAALAAIEGTSNRGRRAAAFAALALYLLGHSDRARASLEALRADAGVPPRIAALLEAIDAIGARYRGARNHDAVERALRALEECDFGGLARSFEALPFHAIFSARVAALDGSERALLRSIAAGEPPAAPAHAASAATAPAQVAELLSKLDVESVEALRDLTIRTGALLAPAAGDPVPA